MGLAMAARPRSGTGGIGRWVADEENDEASVHVWRDVADASTAYRPSPEPGARGPGRLYPRTARRGAANSKATHGATKPLIMDTDTQSSSSGPEPTRSVQAIAIGSRLRAVRHQTGLSLVAVETTSNQEFRASVLGAYERGERVITVDRLQRLARLYNVPVDQLLPEDTSRSTWPEGEEEPETGLRPPGDRSPKVSIDLAKLRASTGPEHEVLRRFLHIIQVHRQDFNGRVISIRTGDVRALACFFGITPDAMGDRLDHLGLRVAL